jgi:hypothetical protein
MLIEVKENEQIIKICKKLVEGEFRKAGGLLPFLRETAEREAIREVKHIAESYDQIETIDGRLRKLETKFFATIEPAWKEISHTGIRQVIEDIFHRWQGEHTSFEDRIARLEKQMRENKREVK